MRWHDILRPYHDIVPSIVCTSFYNIYKMKGIMWKKVKERQGSYIVHIVYYCLVLYLTTQYSLYWCAKQHFQTDLKILHMLEMHHTCTVLVHNAWMVCARCLCVAFQGFEAWVDFFGTAYFAWFYSWTNFICYPCLYFFYIRL